MDFGVLLGQILAPIMPVLRSNASTLFGVFLVITAIGGGIQNAMRFLALVIGLCLFLAGVVPHIGLSAGE
jgi:hypothetical protein